MKNTNLARNKDTQEMIVFRVPKELAQNAKKKASKMMISRSAVCRTALFKYLTEESGTSADTLPQF